MEGVYAPVSEVLQPNAYLDHPRRDLQTTDGLQLTMINPAFMTRLISEEAEAQSGARFHITSLRPLRPGNAPDAWESESLRRFEDGVPEIAEVLPDGNGGSKTLRYMAPLRVETACLKCHRKQGYVVGDIRGGISVSVPYAPIESALKPAIVRGWISYLGVFAAVALLGGVLLELLRRRWLHLAQTIADLEQARAVLDDTNAELRTARDAAERASGAKSVFLSNISHELRTPLAGISGMAHLIRADGLAPKQEERLGKLEQSAHALLGLIDRLLQFSRAESGSITVAAQPFPVNTVLRECLEQHRVAAEARGLSVHAELAALPERLVGDPGILRQIVLAHLDNAVRFTHEGSVTLRTRVESNDAGSLLLRVEIADTGIGMTAEEIARVFGGTFEQADAGLNRRYGGAGLGLAMNRRLVGLLGGEAGVDSEPGRGSTFWFTARFGS